MTEALRRGSRVAIIGAGVSGLVAARRLSGHFDIAVFESDSRIGGHVHTHALKDSEGRPQAVDSGFIVFNEGNYPNLVRLFAELGVESRETCMSFGVRHDPHDLEWSGRSASSLFAQPRNLLRPSHWRMLAQMLRFFREAEGAVPPGDDSITVDEFLQRGRYGRAFAEHFLLPLGAALWSAPTPDIARFPMRFVIDFLANHEMLRVAGRPTWRTVRGGSMRYVEKLIPPFADRIRRACPVRRVTRTDGGLRLASAAGDETFDALVMACHADQALALLAEPSPLEKELLGAFPYTANDVMVHGDPVDMPKRRAAWASWNYHLAAGDPRGAATITYDMNRLQGLESKDDHFVTLNDPGRIKGGRVHARMRYEHPAFGASRSMAQSRHEELIAHQGISYCGAYWGFGFHEDGVRSALRVSERLIGSA